MLRSSRKTHKAERVLVKSMHAADQYKKYENWVEGEYMIENLNLVLK